VDADTRRIALWRAVNVGGRNRVAMSDLRACLAELGCTQPRTLLQSGNAVFGSTLTPAALESGLEAAAQTRFGFQVAVLVRSAREWAAIIAANPFRREAADDPGRVLVMCLKTRASDAAASTLARAIKGRESVHVAGRHLYLVYPDGIGKSTLTTRVIETALGTAGTARNWNTVLKLRALLDR
jgi:uncharacterized protein (DUF1697 family)